MLRREAARYAAFRLCREMGWTLAEYRAHPAAWVTYCHQALGAEGAARERLQRQAEANRRAGMG